MTRKEIREFGQHVVDKVFHKKEQTNTVVAKGWVARDADNCLCFYREKPIKRDFEWTLVIHNHKVILLSDDLFPQVNWTDDKPTPCEIVIKIEK